MSMCFLISILTVPAQDRTNELLVSLIVCRSLTISRLSSVSWSITAYSGSRSLTPRSPSPFRPGVASQARRRLDGQRVRPRLIRSRWRSGDSSSKERCWRTSGQPWEDDRLAW